MTRPSPEFQLVPYTENDRHGLMDFFVKLCRGNHGQADDLMRRIGRNSGVVMVKQGESIVGFSHVYRTGRKSIHFHQAAVLEGHRQQGIFRALLQNVVHAAEKKEITAEIGRDAHHLPTMQRAGFTIDSELPGWRLRIKRPGHKLFG